MKFILQPDQDNLGTLLADDLNSTKYSSFLISAAYARMGGIDALYDAILAFRAAGGTVYAAIGIDQRNTSYEALRAILELSEELYIFHNRSMSSTFHPKVYLLMGEKHGKLYVGSNNLTNGGLYSNYEAAVCEEFDLTVPASAEEFANIIHGLDRFRREGPCCKRASDELIEKLYAGRMVCAEDELRGGSAGAGGAADAAGDAVFGAEPVPGHSGRHDFSRFAPEARPGAEQQTAADAASAASSRGAAEAEEAAGPAKSFYKRLSKNDVKLSSSPGQIIIPIAFQPFFEPLSEPRKMKAGSMQSERYFNLKYENSGVIVENARIVVYVPSPEHPRKNNDVRFTLRSRAVFAEFQQDDVLVFTQAPQSERKRYAYTLKRIARNSPDRSAYSKRFDWIVK